MITDEKRRRVVHTLRQLDNAVDDEPMDRTIAHEASVLSMIRDATFGLDGSIFQRLADLIDYPWCDAEISKTITDKERHEIAEELRTRGACEGFDNCDKCCALSTKLFGDKWVLCHLDDQNVGYWKTLADFIDRRVCNTGVADD